MRNLASTISYIFHPIFITFYLVAISLFLPIFVFQNYPINIKYYILIYVFLLDVAMPISSLVIMKKYGLIASLHIEKKEERTKPYLLMFFFYTITAISFMSIPGIHPIIPFAFILSAIIIVLVNFINRFIKISAHTTSMAGAAAWFYLLFLVFGINTAMIIIVNVVLLGLVMTARLMLKAHSPSEVYLGFALGIIVSIIAGSYYLI